MIRRRKRPAYTLLEIVLALAIAVVLLAALYSAVGYQLRQAQTGRDVTGETTLSRSVLGRIENDVVSSLALCDPARFRNQALDAQQQQAQQQAQSGTTTAGQTSSTPSSTQTNTTITKTQTKSTTTVMASGSGGTTGGSTSTTPQASSSDVTDTVSAAQGTLGQAVILPCGVIGDSTSLTLFASKVPAEALGLRGDGSQLAGDVRKIFYWLGDNGVGLCRQEVKVATADEAQNMTPPTGDVNNYLLAPEIKSVEFRYFDGTSWVDSWDSTVAGDDGSTPIGAPRAIEVRVGVQPAGGKDGDELKYYRHTIAIQTANGITQSSNNGGGVTSP